MARKRNRETKGSDPHNDLKNVYRRTQRYYIHYYQYLYNICLKLFEWKNLPDTVDPGYLERVLLRKGYVAFRKDPKIGYIVAEGALSGRVNTYNMQESFYANTPTYHERFPLFNFKDIKTPGMGVLIRNNETMTSLIPTLEMFASDLAETKTVSRVNLNAQMNPKIFATNEKSLLTMKNLAQQIDGGVMNIFVDEQLDLESIKVFDNTAPIVLDKINAHRDIIWNEIMTFLGVKNTNLQKKERMITDEVKSNDEQIEASKNVLLSARQDAATLINELYGLQVSVDYRMKEGEKFALHETVAQDNRTGKSV